MFYSLIHVHILGAYVHICAKYEVSVIKPVDRRTVHRWWCQQQWQWRQWWYTMDNSWLYRLLGRTAKWAKNIWHCKVICDYPKGRFGLHMSKAHWGSQVLMTITWGQFCLHIQLAWMPPAVLFVQYSNMKLTLILPIDTF